MTGILLIEARKQLQILEMLSPTIHSQHEQALVSLLDDPAPIVQEHLQAEFRRIGARGLELLRSVEGTDCGDCAKAASRMLALFDKNANAALLQKFIREMRYELETGLLLINQLIFPELQVEEVEAILDGLARRCLELRVTPMVPREQCNLMSRVFFHEFGFSCRDDNNVLPEDNCLDMVCRRRKGSPLLVCALYILTGQRIGLELEPILLPSSFMVGCFYGASPFYVDPRHGGRLRESTDLEQCLRAEAICPEFADLAPVPVRDVLRLCCVQLVSRLEAQQQFRLARHFADCIREFDTSYERARNPERNNESL